MSAVDFLFADRLTIPAGSLMVIVPASGESYPESGDGVTYPTEAPARRGDALEILVETGTVKLRDFPRATDISELTASDVTDHHYTHAAGGYDSRASVPLGPLMGVSDAGAVVYVRYR